MEIRPIQTRPLVPPQDDLLAVIDGIDLELRDASVIAVSAKVVAIHEGRSVLMPQSEAEVPLQRDQLAKKESELYLERDEAVPFPRVFTIHDGTFCSSAGIDASNGDGYFIMLPKHSFQFAHTLREHLKSAYNISQLGVLIVDSRTYPMRNGTIGLTLGYAGFQAMYDYRGTDDIFGRRYRAERINVADCLASTAVLAMGEGDESTPLTVMSNVPHIQFAEEDMPDDLFLTLKVPMEQDVFAQFFRDHDWKKGGGYTM